MRLPGHPWVKIPLRHPSEMNPVPIVADGMIATAVMGEGRHIPLLILDTSSRPDIETMVLAHQEFGPGDVIFVWSFKERWFGLASPLLLLRITKPSECVVVIEFDMTKRQGILVDQILWAQSVYLRPGRPGDRLATTIDKPSILAEVPASEAFDKRFQRIHEKALFRSFRKKGMSRADSKQSVEFFLKGWRGVFHQRIPFRQSSEEFRAGTTSSDDGSEAG